MGPVLRDVVSEHAHTHTSHAAAPCHHTQGVSVTGWGLRGTSSCQRRSPPQLTRATDKEMAWPVCPLDSMCCYCPDDGISHPLRAAQAIVSGCTPTRWLGLHGRARTDQDLGGFGDHPVVSGQRTVYHPGVLASGQSIGGRATVKQRHHAGGRGRCGNAGCGVVRSACNGRNAWQFGGHVGSVRGRLLMPCKPPSPSACPHVDMPATAVAASQSRPPLRELNFGSVRHACVDMTSGWVWKGCVVPFSRTVLCTLFCWMNPIFCFLQKHSGPRGPRQQLRLSERRRGRSALWAPEQQFARLPGRRAVPCVHARKLFVNKVRAESCDAEGGSVLHPNTSGKRARLQQAQLMDLCAAENRGCLQDLAQYFATAIISLNQPCDATHPVWISTGRPIVPRDCDELVIGRAAFITGLRLLRHTIRQTAHAKTHDINPHLTPTVFAPTCLES